MTVLAPSPPPRPDELKALIEEARRRQRRRRRGIASVSLAIAAGIALTVWLTAGSHSHSRPVTHATPAAHPAAASRITGADTSLLMWPAGTPVFGDLPGGGSGETVRIADLGTGQSRVARIPHLVGGDSPYTLVPDGPWIVYNSARGIAAIRSDLRGRMRILGHADWFVPGVRGSVWLADRRGSPVRPTGVRRVNVATGAQSDRLVLPKDTAQVITGTARGLLMITGGPEHYRLALWRTGSRPAILAPLGFGVSNLFAATPREVAYGSSCRLPRHEGNVVCRRLIVRDLVTGRRWSVPAPDGTLGWAPRDEDVMGEDGVVSPDRRHLVAQAALGGRHRIRLYTVAMRTAGHRVTPVPQSPSLLFTRLAWTTRGDWLVYQTASHRLAAWRPGSTPRTLAVPCCQYATVVSTRPAP
jgi:hypothetical protein